MKKTSREKAQAHAKHAYFCSCGYVVHGNGARAKHRDMHKRKDDGHSYWSHTAWIAHGSPYLNHPNPEQRRPIFPPEAT